MLHCLYPLNLGSEAHKYEEQPPILHIYVLMTEVFTSKSIYTCGFLQPKKKKEKNEKEKMSGYPIWVLPSKLLYKLN